MQQTLFQHQRQEDQDQQIDNVVDLVISKFNLGQKLFIYSGPMAAGKTAVTIKLAQYFSQDRKVHIYRLDDNRSDPSSIYSRNIILHKGGNINIELFDFRKGTDQIRSDILNGTIVEGSVLFVSEAQFAASSPDGIVNTEVWQELIELAEALDIVIICDALSNFYNLEPVPDTQFLRNRIPEPIQMQACDSFDQTRFANMSMRMVAIAADDGSVVDELDQQHSRYYMEMSADERFKLVNRIKETEFAKLLRVERNGRSCYLVPSHPSLDDPYIPGGNERYFPTSLKTCKRILTAYGLNQVRREYVDIFIQNLRNNKEKQLVIES